MPPMPKLSRFYAFADQLHPDCPACMGYVELFRILIVPSAFRVVPAILPFSCAGLLTDAFRPASTDIHSMLPFLHFLLGVSRLAPLPSGIRPANFLIALVLLFVFSPLWSIRLFSRPSCEKKTDCDIEISGDPQSRKTYITNPRSSSRILECSNSDKQLRQIMADPS